MRTFFILIVLMQVNHLFAQQMLPTRLLWDNMAALNPAARPVSMLANKDRHRGYVDLGSKAIVWGDQSPRVISLLAGWGLDPKNTLALNIRREDAGIWSQTEVAMNYAYALQSDKNHYLALGLSTGWNQSVTNQKRAQVRDPGDIEADASESNNVFDVGFGIFYAKKNRVGIPFFGGLSFQNLKIVTSGIQNNLLSVSPVPHFLGFVGAQQTIGRDNYVEEILMIRYVNHVPLYGELLGRLHLNGRFWIGAGGTTAKSLVADAGFKDPRFQIGLSFEFWIQVRGNLPLTPELRVLVPFVEAK